MILIPGHQYTSAYVAATTKLPVGGGAAETVLCLIDERFERN